jgi:hypothetical protein
VGPLSGLARRAAPTLVLVARLQARLATRATYGRGAMKGRTVLTAVCPIFPVADVEAALRTTPAWASTSPPMPKGPDTPSPHAMA